MKRLLILFLALPLAAHAADDGRVSFLEQEVRNLQREVQNLSRRIDVMSTRPARTYELPRMSSAAVGAEPAWLDAGKWSKVKAGMSELEVVSLLGPATSMRGEANARVLFYALEIGTSGFLGGSVRLRNRVVAEVRAPMLQ
jgi:hypothetical protein